MIASLVADFVADFVANFFATTFLTLAVPFQPHAAVKPSTISRWIIATLDLAGIDAGAGAHEAGRAHQVGVNNLNNADYSKTSSRK